MFAKISQRRGRPGSMKALAGAYHDAEPPDITSVPGFVAYYVLDLGDDEWATIAIFEDEEGVKRWTDKAVGAAKRSEVARHLKTDPHSIYSAAGRVVFSRTAKGK